MKRDDRRLKLLMAFQRISAVITGLLALIGSLPLSIGVKILLFSPDLKTLSPAEYAETQNISLVFLCLGLVMFLTGALATFALLYTARCIDRRENYLFCRRMLIFQFVFLPFGGILHLLGLNLDMLKEYFEGAGNK